MYKEFRKSKKLTPVDRLDWSRK